MSVATGQVSAPAEDIWKIRGRRAIVNRLMTGVM